MMDGTRGVAEPGARPDGGQRARYKVFMCVVCGFVYEEEYGLPEEGIAPGTLWSDVPEEWVCPDCQAAKDDFEMIEI